MDVPSRDAATPLTDVANRTAYATSGEPDHQRSELPPSVTATNPSTTRTGRTPGATWPGKRATTWPSTSVRTSSPTKLHPEALLPPRCTSAVVDGAPSRLKATTTAAHAITTTMTPAARRRTRVEA